MSVLVKIGNAAFRPDKIVAVEGDRVVFDDGRTIRVSRRTVEMLLKALPEWKAAGWTPTLPEGDGR